MSTQVPSAQAAVELVADQAIDASIQKTFAVGGAIVENATGNVVHAMHNNVLQPFAPGTTFTLHDPTAHGERQLVDWYFANRDALRLPPPEQLTVITTLDPCAMCTGSLLTAGFNVAVSAIDTYAGINYDERFDFPTLPPEVRAKAQATWGYYAVAAPYGRPYAGSNTPAFAGQEIDARVFTLTLSVFGASVDTVRGLANTGGLDPSQMTDPSTLPADSPVRAALAELYADTLTVRSDDPRLPGLELAKPLMDAAYAAQQAGGAFNAVALLDACGNLLLCLGGAESASPIRTAFMETTRAYAGLRWRLMNDADPAVRAEAQQTLAHAKYCTFVFLYAPDPSTPQAVMTFGAYGSTMEGPIPRTFPSSFQYLLTPRGVTDGEIVRLAAALPPFYTSDVAVAPQRVANPDLVADAEAQRPD